MIVLRTVSEILTAGIAITAFSLLLYAMAFNLRDRVARSFAIILTFVVIVFTAEAIGGTETDPQIVNFFLRFQWVGIVFLPAAYLHFSDALLATTGKPSRGRRRWAVRLTYLGSFVFLMGLPFDYLVGPTIYDQPPAPHLEPTIFTTFFMAFYIGIMLLSWINFVRAYRRTTTQTSRRRMLYLITGALAPALGGLPFLPYGPGFAAQHLLIFWSVSLLANVVVGILLIVMAYSVAFFGVSWPDRVVKSRLFKWIMRGPFTASVTLSAVTLIRRAGEAVGSSSYTALVPIVMVATILLVEYLITLFSPAGERWLFYGKEKEELDALRNLENQLLTRNDLRQFLELILAASCDRLQAAGAYVADLSAGTVELVVTTGKTRFKDGGDDGSMEDGLLRQLSQDETPSGLFRWGDDFLFPLYNGTPDRPEIIGLLGVTGTARETLDEEQLQAMDVLVERAALALKDRRVQQTVFDSLESLSPQMNLIQRLRAAGQFDRSGVLANEENLPVNSDISNWVKDALTHYWGGPKLTQNPLMRLKVVQAALVEYDGNHANALRSILKQAIDRVRPEGERRFTAEWILYNILELKFLEGRKVREVALRLAMSEADLYRKQRIAVEAVARAIGEMELLAQKEVEQ